MMLALAALICGLQDPDLQAVLASQERRVATIDRCAAAVCSVMSMDSPGGGSGVVFDPAGFVLTNYHVVGKPDDDYDLPDPPDPPAELLERWLAEHPGADEAAQKKFLKAWKDDWRDEHWPTGTDLYKPKKVGMPDGRLYEGIVLGIDPGSDLAVLRLVPKEPGQTWPWCDFGDSDRLLVGETVFAMGNPFLLATDFTPTVTFGIVSGTHRYQSGQGQRLLVYPDCIQVDAPVNPGNSGGPLFNESGQIVGINGRISIGDRGRVNVGVGFAIASNQIVNFLGDLMAGRHAEHGTLDMSAWFMNSGIGDERRRGVYVQQIYSDAVIAAAGVSIGDEITWFNGTEVRSANQLATLIGVLPAFTWVTVGYRPTVGDGFGKERRTLVKMAVLDTGSSKDGYGEDARLACRLDRRLGATTLLRRITRTGDARAEQWDIVDGDGTATRARSDGARLRLELGPLALVLAGTDAAGGFAVENGAARELTTEELARLERELRCNPLLWPPAQLPARLADAELFGGVHVLGTPGFRYRLPGEGDCEAWLTIDGEPLGCAFRDPLRKARVEYHVHGDRLFVVVDGEPHQDWRITARGDVEFDEGWFRRPQ
ncbi:MAG: trypsin-like peptidase domain-containing protein [Planctomycetes bacterium]|nr:trypsin-like peptidase domain-containing protein [Planctomycetota bacterium]